MAAVVAVVVGGRKRKKVDGDDRDLWIIVTKYFVSLILRKIYNSVETYYSSIYSSYVSCNHGPGSSNDR